MFQQGEYEGERSVKPNAKKLKGGEIITTTKKPKQSTIRVRVWLSTLEQHDGMGWGIEHAILELIVTQFTDAYLHHQASIS